MFRAKRVKSPYSNFSGDFHFTWECLQLSLQSLWGSDSCPGTMHHLKKTLGLKMVDQNARKFQPSDEFFRQVRLISSQSAISIRNCVRYLKLI